MISTYICFYMVSMTQHCTITGTMLVPVHYIICTLKNVFFPEITVFVVVKINSFQCQLTQQIGQILMTPSVILAGMMN